MISYVIILIGAAAFIAAKLKIRSISKELYIKIKQHLKQVKQ